MSKEPDLDKLVLEGFSKGLEKIGSPGANFLRQLIEGQLRQRKQDEDDLAAIEALLKASGKGR